jgi:hypothetical protein
MVRLVVLSNRFYYLLHSAGTRLLLRLNAPQIMPIAQGNVPLLESFFFSDELLEQCRIIE